MINIVFLLLIFFLITSSLVPRPVEIIERPFGLSDSSVEDPNYLFITGSSEIMYLGQTGEIAWDLIKKRGPIQIPDSKIQISNSKFHVLGDHQAPF